VLLNQSVNHTHSGLFMSLINEYNDKNDPGQGVFNNAPPLAIPPQIAAPINEPVVPIPNPLTAIPTETQAVEPTEIQTELQKETDRRLNEELANPNSSAAATKEPTLTPTEIETNQQTVQESVSQFGLSSHDEMVRKGEIDNALINETEFTNTHLPTVYSGGNYDFNSNYTSALNSAKLLPGQSSVVNQFSTEPLPRDNRREFNSLAPSQFSTVMPEGADKIKPWGDGALSTLFYGLGVISNTTRGAIIDAVRVRNGLVSKLPQPAQNVLNFSPFKLISGGKEFIRPDQNYAGSYTVDAIRGRQYNFTSNINSKDNPIGFTGILGTNNWANDAGADAVGKVFDFTTRALTGNIVKPGADFVKKNRWSVDPSFWVGFVADSVLDPSDIIGGALLKPVIGTVKKAVVGRSAARAAAKAPAVVERVIVTPTGRGSQAQLPQGAEPIKPVPIKVPEPVKPNNTEVGITKYGQRVRTSPQKVVVTPIEDVVRGVPEPWKQPALPDAQSRRPDAVQKFNYVQSRVNDTELRVPAVGAEARQPLQLPGSAPNPDPNWRWSTVVDGSVNPDNLRPIIEVVRNKPQEFTRLGGDNWSFWREPEEAADVGFIPAPIDVSFRVVKEPVTPRLPEAPNATDIIQGVDGEVRVPSEVQPTQQLALPYGEPYPLVEWDFSADGVKTQNIARRRIEIPVKQTTTTSSTPFVFYPEKTTENFLGNNSGIIPQRKPFPVFGEPKDPVFTVAPPKSAGAAELTTPKARDIFIPESQHNILKSQLSSGEYTEVYDALLKKRVPLGNVRRSIELGNIEEAGRQLRELFNNQVKPLNQKQQVARKVSVVRSADKKVVTRTVKPSTEAAEIIARQDTPLNVDVVDVNTITITPETPATPLSIDAVNDSIRSVEPGTPLIAPTEEINTLIKQQLDKAVATLRRKQAEPGANPAVIESYRKKVVELRKSLLVDDSVDDVIVNQPPAPVTNVVDASVLRGTMSLSEVSRILLDGIPGTNINPRSIDRVVRTVEQVEALMKVIPNPNTGEPLLTTNAKRFFRTFNSESPKSPTAYLVRQGITDPRIINLFKREGAAIDINALSSPEFRVVLDTPVPGQTSKQVVVSNAAAQLPKAVTEPLPETLPELRKLKKELEKELDKTDGSVKAAQPIINRLMDVEHAIQNPVVIDNPVNLKVLQDEVIPDTQHGTSPEVVALTQRKLELIDKLSDAGERVQTLEVEVTRQKAQLEQALERLDTIADTIPAYPVIINEPTSSRIEQIAKYLKVEQTTAPSPELAKRVQAANKWLLKTGEWTDDDYIEALKVADDLTNWDESTKMAITASVVNKLGNDRVKFRELKQKATSNVLPKERTVVVSQRKPPTPEQLADENYVEPIVLYHGTRVNSWDKDLGGYGEWGSGTYYSVESADAVNHALKPSREELAKQGVEFGAPRVHEVEADFVNVVDVNQPADDEFVGSVMVGAKFGLPPENAKQIEKLLNRRMTDKPDTTPAQIYTWLEKYYSKHPELDPDSITLFKSEINKSLGDVGYDAISDGNTYLAINSSGVNPVYAHSIEETDTLGSSVAAYNASSNTASANAGIPSVNAAHAEESIKLQRQMYEDSLDKLEDAKRLQRNVIIEQHEVDSLLTETAQVEQSATKKRVVEAGQADAERTNQKLNTGRTNPCEF
jgi:hypothetical protein